MNRARPTIPEPASSQRQRPPSPLHSPDWYLRAVLTLISVCLLVLVAEGGLLPARSQPASWQGVTKVAICDPTGKTCLPLLQDMNGANGIRVFTGAS